MKVIRIPCSQKVVKRLERNEKAIKTDQYLSALQLPSVSLRREMTRKSNLVL
jgi:hypothetical protein